MGEYIRSWRTQDTLQATAQALRPAGTIHYVANQSWMVDGQFAWTRGESFQEYDNTYSSFFITYYEAGSSLVQRLRRRVQGRISPAIFRGSAGRAISNVHRNCPEWDAHSSRLSPVDFLAQGST